MSDATTILTEHEKQLHSATARARCHEQLAGLFGHIDGLVEEHQKRTTAGPEKEGWETRGRLGDKIDEQIRRADDLARRMARTLIQIDESGLSLLVEAETVNRMQQMACSLARYHARQACSAARDAHRSAWALWLELYGLSAPIGHGHIIMGLQASRNAESATQSARNAISAAHNTIILGLRAAGPSRLQTEEAANHLRLIGTIDNPSDAELEAILERVEIVADGHEQAWTELAQAS